MQQVRAHYSQKTGKSLIGSALAGINPLYDRLVILGSFFSLIGMCVAIYRADARLFVFTGMWFAFVMMHALALLSYERYAFPAFSVALMNLIVVPAWIYRSKLESLPHPEALPTVSHIPSH